ncbi:MAG: hypothetical protein ABI600_08850 [Luteolibacter sp.]
MKAIVHMCNGAVGVPELEHNYRGFAKRSAHEREFEGSRVFDVLGNARGTGVIMTEPGFERGMLAMLAGPNAYKMGKTVRQTIISAESTPNAKPEEFDATLRVLSEAAERWVEAHAPNCRWVAFVHQDRHHGHVHIAFENWDYELGHRLDFSPALCSKMQDMSWCAGLGITSGKGSLGKVINGKKLAAARVDLSTAKTWHERVELCAWNVFASRKDAAKELLQWCAAKRPEKSVEGLLDALLGEPLPPGWEVKSKTKGGGDLKEPSVKIDGKTLRLTTFLDTFAPKPVKTIKDQTKTTSHAPQI